jgi:hypothetical protein
MEGENRVRMVDNSKQNELYFGNDDATSQIQAATLLNGTC